MFSWEALEGVAVGGVAAYASRLAAGLAKAGHRVRLFTRLGEGQALEETVDGVLVKRCPWDRKQSFFEEITALASSFGYYFRESLRRDGPCDIVHCHEWLTIEAGLAAVAAVPARLAVSFHSTEWGRTGVWPDSGDSARIAAIERAGVERADAVVSASYLVRRRLEQQFHIPDWKSEVVYHGADLAAFDAQGSGRAAGRERLGIAADEPCVLFAGRFSPQSGADLAAEAAGIVAGRLGAARFAFVGAGRLEEAMRRDAGPRAIFHAPPGWAVPPDLYRAADLVLAPFRRDLNGRAILPAWAAAKPVVAVAGTVPSEFILDGVNGWVCRADAGALAECVQNALDNPEPLEWMGRNGRVAVETAFTWDEAVKRLINAYGRKERLTPAE